MIIVLSQKIDTDSTYSGDDVFRIYHYPSRYKNQIHTGDIFVYYQGNRYDKKKRYYFGVGRVGEISKENEDDYYAELLFTTKFIKKVPIYMANGGYVEQLGYETVRKSMNPPWQSSVRTISIEAFKYILDHSESNEIVYEYNNLLKKSIQKYYISNQKGALMEIINLIQKLLVLYT